MSACGIAPVYRSDTTRFGVNISTRTETFQEAVNKNEALFGRLPAVRVYDTVPPLDRAWEGQRALPRYTSVVVSFNYPAGQVLKGIYDAQIRRFFRNAPKQSPVFWSYYHEPETPVRVGDFTAAQYRSAFRHIAMLAANLCRTNLYPTLILMGWTLTPRSHLDWRDYFPGKRYVSVLAWDPFNSTTLPVTTYQRPEDMFRRIVDIAQQTGLRWGIAETGSTLIPGDAGAQRALWLRSLANYCEVHHAAFVTYFNGIGRPGGVDFRLHDSPSLRVWREQMNRS